MSRDKEFRRPKDAVRQPARKTETDVRAGEVRGQDFDLRRARDAPVQEDNRHRGRNLYQGGSEDGTVPAADSSVDYTASRQASGDSVPDSRGDSQQSGPNFSGRDSFRESRQQDSAPGCRLFPARRPGVVRFRQFGGFRCFRWRQYKCRGNTGQTPDAPARQQIPAAFPGGGKSRGTPGETAGISRRRTKTAFQAGIYR